MITSRYIFLGIFLSFIACETLGPIGPMDEETLDGPIEGLSAEQHAIFLRGDRAFSDVFTIGTGLGPLFVANQCAACHAGDGKGNPFVQFTRFGQSDTTGNKFLDMGGPQLQHKAIPGYQPEQLPADVTFTTLIAPAVTGLGYLDAVSDTYLIILADPDDIDSDGISGRPHWNNIPDYVTLRPNSVTQGGRYITRVC